MTLIFSVVLAALFALLAFLGQSEKLPLNAFYGFRTEKTMSSHEAWMAAHRAAAPANAVASVSFAITALVAGTITETTRSESLSAIVGWVVGFLALGAAIYIAQRTATKVVSSS